MSEHRVLLIESACRLTVNLGRLRIQRHGQRDAYVLPEDIATLVLHHPAVMLSGQVLQRLAGAGAMLLITDSRHMPAGLLLPWLGDAVRGTRLRQQIALDGTERAKHLWATVVTARIQTQAATLRALQRNGALRLERLAGRVRPGDPDNLEAQAAKHYWSKLLPNGVHRDKRGATDPLNVRLNFGYAVLRSLIAREISVAGLTPSLGVGHRSLENPFNLADDLLEVYRFLVERRVLSTLATPEFLPGDRVALAGVVADEVKMPGGIYRVPAAVAETAASYCRCLASDDATLTLPQSPCR